MTTSNLNPFCEPKLEKSGSHTFSKYDYQYHWALYRVLQKHSNEEEYAVFVELVEDVVVASSPTKAIAKFEFAQVKANKKAFTISDLLRKKGSTSPLGKLIKNCSGKDYSDLIEEIDFVSASGFDFGFKDSKLHLEKICTSDLEENTFKKLQSHLDKEVGQPIPINLFFISPNLPINDYEIHLTGVINELVRKIYPESYFKTSSTNSIYLALMDELRKKGKNIFDYRNWDDAIEKKALTSITVTKVINMFVSNKDEVSILAEFNEILNFLGLNPITGKNLRKAFDRYRAKRTGERLSNELKTITSIKEALEKNASKCDNDIKQLLEMAGNDLPPEVRDQFTSNDEMKSAIIYEYITA